MKPLSARPVSAPSFVSLLVLLPMLSVAAEPELRLQPTVVTATLSEQTLRDAPASVSVIDRDALQQRPVQDLEDALRGVPGLQFSGVGMTRRGISIRGMSSEHTLVLLNGQRINTSAAAIAHADFDLGWVPVEAIERIEVVRGPMSSLYGSEALGGVVNVITRKATDHWRGSATLNGGQSEHGPGGQTHQLAAYVGGPLIPGVLGLSLNAESRRREATPNATDKAMSDIEGRDANSGTATLSWTPDGSQRIDLSVGRGQEDRWRDTRSAGARPVDYAVTEFVEREQTSVAHNGDWQWGSSQVRAYRNSLERSNRYSNGVVPTSPYQLLIDDIVDASLTVPVGEGHQLSAGGEWRKERLDDDGFDDGKAQAIHRALFVQGELELAPDWSLVLGNRFDHHQHYGWQNSPRAYAVYRVNEALTLKGGGGRGFKAPTLKQLSPDHTTMGGGGRFTIHGNPQLRPEINTTYELAGDYQGNGWSLNAGVFQNNVRGLVQTTCVANCGLRGRELRDYDNVDKARLRGLELGGGVDLPAQLHLALNYTHLDAIDLTTDKRLADRSRHLANSTLKWQPTEAFQAQLRAEYVGSQRVYVSNVAHDVPAYSLWHLELSQHISPQLSVRGGVENLGDERLAEASPNVGYPEPGRTFHVGLNLSF